VNIQRHLPKMRRLAIWVALGAAVYFGNVEVQSWMGRRAVASMGLEERSLSDALLLASTEERLVLADLSAIWCGTCRRLHKDVFSDPRVQDAIRRNYIFARIEYETREGKDFRERYGVRGFPALLVLDGAGQVVRRLPVVFDPDRFLENLERGTTDEQRARRASR
jgi:thiol:disulfide interchange protein